MLHDEVETAVVIPWWGYVTAAALPFGSALLISFFLSG